MSRSFRNISAQIDSQDMRPKPRILAFADVSERIRTVALRACMPMLMDRAKKDAGDPRSRKEMGQGAARVSCSELRVAIELANNVARIASVFSNPHRSRIAALAIKQPGLNFSAVAALLEVSVSLVSYHAGQLELAGFIRHKRAGRSKIILPNHSSMSTLFCALGEAGAIVNPRRAGSR